MTDLTAHRPIQASDTRSTLTQRRRWRYANTAITASISVTVLATSIYLGVTGPTTSPVSPAAATLSDGASAAARAGAAADRRQGTLDAGGPRDGAGRFGRHRGRGR